MFRFVYAFPVGCGVYWMTMLCYSLTGCLVALSLFCLCLVALVLVFALPIIRFVLSLVIGVWSLFVLAVAAKVLMLWVTHFVVCCLECLLFVAWSFAFVCWLICICDCCWCFVWIFFCFDGS